MSRTLDATQSELVQRADLRVVPLMTIVVYSDRDAETVDTTYYVSDRLVRYAWEAGADREFLPWLGGLAPVRLESTIDHIPSLSGGGRSWRRPLNFVLQNLRWPDDDSGTRLAETLRGKNMERALVTYAELIVDSLGTHQPLDLLSSHTGDEHTVQYRGLIKRFGPFDQNAIQVYCESEIPSVPWVLVEVATEARNLGERCPVVYGSPAFVRCPATTTTPRGTLPGGTTATATSIVVQELDGSFTSTGSGWLEGERISWTGGPGGTVVRGVAGTIASAHPAGAILIERGSHQWAYHYETAGDLDAVWTRNPYNQELTKLSDSDWSASTDTVGGATVATIEMTEGEFDSVMSALQQAAVVEVQPGTGSSSTIDASNPPESVEFDGANGDNMIDEDTGTTATFRASRNDEAYFTFPVLSGPATLCTLRVYVTSTGANDLSVKSSGAGDPMLDYDIDPGFSAPGWWTQALSAPDLDHRFWKIESSAFDGTGWVVGEFERNITYDAPTALAVDTQINAGTIGYRLDIYADMDGIEASGGDYSTSDGQVIDDSVDAIRHWIADVGGLGHGAIDTAAFDALASQSPTLDLDMRPASGWEDGLRLLQFSNMCAIYPVETATATVWTISCWNYDLLFAVVRWGVPTRSLTTWAPNGFVEMGRDVRGLRNRFTFLGDFDASLPFGQEWTRLDKANKDDNGVSLILSTAQLEDSETNFGALEAEPIGFLGAIGILSLVVPGGVYANEVSRAARIFTLEGVHWAEAYDLLPGEIVQITPPWSSTAVDARVLEVGKNPGDHQYRVVATDLIPTCPMLGDEDSDLGAAVSSVLGNGQTVAEGEALIVLIASLETDDADQEITSVFWDVAGANEEMTVSARNQQTDTGANVACWVAYLARPTAASSGVTVTFDGIQEEVVVWSAALEDVDASTVLDVALATDAGVGSTFDTDIVTTTQATTLIDICAQKGTGFFDGPDPPQADIFSILGTGFRVSVEGKRALAVGTHTMSRTSLDADANVHTVAAIRRTQIAAVAAAADPQITYVAGASYTGDETNKTAMDAEPYTVSAGSDKLLLLCIGITDSSGTDAVLTTAPVWEAAGGDESFTMGARNSHTAGGGTDPWCWIGYLALGEEPGETANIQVTFDGACSNVQFFVMEFDGVDQSTVMDAAEALTDGTGDFTSDTITTATINAMLVDLVSTKGTDATGHTTPVAQDEKVDQRIAANGTMSVSTKTATAEASYGMDRTDVVDVKNLHTIVALRAAT